MLPKKNRLTKAQVNFLLDKGVKQRSTGFNVIFNRNNVNLCRFCIIIGKKLKLKQVDRNRLRRRIYDILRKNLNVLESYHLDAAVIPFPEIVSSEFEEVEKKIILTLNNLKKWAKTY